MAVREAEGQLHSDGSCSPRILGMANTWLNTISPQPLSQYTVSDFWPPDVAVTAASTEKGLHRLFEAAGCGESFSQFCERALSVLLCGVLREARLSHAAPPMWALARHEPLGLSSLSASLPLPQREDRPHALPSLVGALWQARTALSARSPSQPAAAANTRCNGPGPRREEHVDDLVSNDGSDCGPAALPPPRSTHTQPFALSSTDLRWQTTTGTDSLDVASPPMHAPCAVWPEIPDPVDASERLPSAAASLSVSRIATTTMNATYVDDCEDGTAELNQYVLLDTLGKGTQGEVHLAMDTEKSELRAIKAVHRPVHTSPSRSLNAARMLRRQQLEREVAIMKKCRHKHVVRLYEVIDDPAQDTVYLVMQYVQHGPIATVAPDGSVSNTVRPELLARYARQLVDGLEYLHKRGIVHRDIKPENVLLGQDEQVYLADFGAAELFDHTQSARVAGTQGTLAFLAPELLLAGDEPDDRDRSTSTALLPGQRSPVCLCAQSSSTRHTNTVEGGAVDVWALGVTLYALLHGELPFFGNNASSLFRSVLTASASFVPQRDSVFHSRTASTASGSLNSRQSDSSKLGQSTSAEVEPPIPATGEWRKLLEGMLRKDPATRSTLGEVRAALSRIDAAFARQARGHSECEAAVTSLRTRPTRLVVTHSRSRILDDGT